ncbi:Uncharacterised protein r2_g4299 [Pycnogonum litorale]
MTRQGFHVKCRLHIVSIGHRRHGVNGITVYCVFHIVLTGSIDCFCSPKDAKKMRGCSSTYFDNVSWHKFPKTSRLWTKFVATTRSDFKCPSPYSRVFTVQ